jgi:hypothetical protein
MPCRLNIPDPTLRNTIPLTDPLTDQYSGLCKCPQMFDVRDSRDRPDVPLGVTRELTSLVWETSPVRATAHLGSNRPRWTSRCPCLSPVRIESAFIADHVEVDPTTRTLDVRTGFQSYVIVPHLPFRHVLGLAIVVQVAFDEYDHPFSLAIDVERVDDLPVMHHEDFTFEIPHGIGVMDGISHHYPFAFSLPVEFYEVGVHGSSSVTMIRTMRSSPSSYRWSPWDTTEFGPRAAQHPLNPCLLRATRGSETAGHLAYTRRAMPAFLSIQLTHVSCGVSEIALARESPAQRPSGRILLWRTTTCSDRSPGAGSSARYGKRVPVPHPMRPHPMHTVRDIKRVCRLRKRERRPCPDAAPPGVS